MVQAHQNYKHQEDRVGEVTDRIQKKITEFQEWTDYAQSQAITKLRERMEREIINPAKEAFHTVDIDGVTDAALVRNTITQRAVIKTAKRILDFFDSAPAMLAQAKAELKKIEASGEHTKPKAGSKGQQP